LDFGVQEEKAVASKGRRKQSRSID
jgi:hypothetical protein